MCCHRQVISPPGFASLMARPINSPVLESNPIASSGIKWGSQVLNRSTERFYCNLPIDFANPKEVTLG